MRALSIRQPWAQMILRGEKTTEYRSRPTKIIGQRFYLYAPKASGPMGAPGLPTGVIVGTAILSRCAGPVPRPESLRDSGLGEWVYEWHISEVRPLARPRKPARKPQPVWFKPFGDGRA